MRRQLIENIIKDQLTPFINEVGEFNYNKTFNVPDNVANVAKHALDNINVDIIVKNTEHGSGREKAVELSGKKSQTVDQLKKMAKFFEAHTQDASKIRQQGEPKTPDEISFAQSWNLRGGDSGAVWVKRELEKFHDENLRTKKNLRKSGGAGENKGMGIFDTTIMSTTKSRIHR